MEVQNGIFSRDSKGTGQCKNQAWHEEGEGEGGGEKEEWEKKTVSMSRAPREERCRPGEPAQAPEHSPLIQQTPSKPWSHLITPAGSQAWQVSPFLRK